MLNCSRIFADGGLELIIGLLAAGKLANLSVVKVELYMLIEDFSLYRLSDKRVSAPAFVCLNRCKTSFANRKSRIAEHRDWILLTSLPKLFIKFFRRCNDRNWNKSVTAAVTNLVLYIALFVTGSWIAKISLETIVEHETVSHLLGFALRLLVLEPHCSLVVKA